MLQALLTRNLWSSLVQSHDHPGGNHPACLCLYRLGMLTQMFCGFFAGDVALPQLDHHVSVFLIHSTSQFTAILL